MSERVTDERAPVTRPDRGFALTLGVSLLVHAAALGAVGVLAASSGAARHHPPRPALEVVWVSDIGLSALPPPTGEEGEGGKGIRGDGAQGRVGTREREAKTDAKTLRHRIAEKVPMGASEPGRVAEEKTDAGGGAVPRSLEASVQAMTEVPGPLAAERAIEEGVKGPSVVPGAEAESASDRGSEGAEPSLASAEDAADTAEPQAKIGGGWDALGGAGLESSDGGGLGDPSPGKPPLRLSRPEYPPLSRRLGEEGTVLLAMRFGPDGQVREARVEQSSGFARLDGAALDAARAERMEPGGASNLTFRVAYTFRLEE